MVAALAITSTVGYGVLTYAFSALLGPMSAELRISTTTAVGASTTAVLVSGLMSIPVGRWLDARGGRGLMASGSLLGAIAVLGWSQVQNTLQLYGVFVAVGVASAMVLYPPAFAVVVAVADPAARTKAILSITIVGGFASSIFIPLTGHLAADYGWRAALVDLAAALAVTTIPLHAFLIPRTTPAPRTTTKTPKTPARVLKDPGFWLLAGAFVVHSAALAMISVHLVLYLIGLGHPPARAATLAGLLGLLSVTGRLVTSLSARWLPMATITATVLGIQGLSISLLPVVGKHLSGAIVCLVLFGLGFGVSSIATPAILLDRYGADGYATISGILTTPVTIAKAVGPLGGAVVANALGYRDMVLTVAAGCLVAATALALTPRPSTTM
ncbi:putative MFS family arabinose efflux permease [Kribbella antiqua]|uniref:Putative MFS family arabinose efflux permease n=1 Tax=Kribbella antiqua TaxID=2512217 RepID=A0A4R2IKX5_9ACTN|nr:putative MFS family arabinose efflux permease [Kribbella antiqua]